MSETFRVASIDHVELWVPDQRAAADWYRRVLGLEIVQKFEHWADGGPLMVATAEGPTMLALFAGEPDDTSMRRTPDFRRVAFRIDGTAFRAFLAWLPELELDAEGGGRLDDDDWIDHGESISIYFRDPWGHALEITTYEPDVVRRDS